MATILFRLCRTARHPFSSELSSTWLKPINRRTNVCSSMHIRRRSIPKEREEAPTGGLFAYYGGPKRRSQIWASFSGSKLRLQTASVALNRQRLVLGCCPPQFCELEFHQLQKSLATFHFVSGFCCQELLCDKLNDLKAKREAAKKAVRDAKKEEKNALRKRARLLKASHAPSTF